MKFFEYRHKEMKVLERLSCQYIVNINYVKNYTDGQPCSLKIS